MQSGVYFKDCKDYINNYEINVEITNAEVAQAFKYSDPNKFYDIFRNYEFDATTGVNDTFDKAQKLVSERAQYQAGAARWMTEKCGQCMVSTDELMGLICVIANEKFFPSDAVKDCKRVVMTAVKKGADIYTPMASILEAQKVQEQLYESLPSSIETYEQYEDFANKSDIICRKTFEIQKYSPYAQPVADVIEIAKLQTRRERAEQDGDMETVTSLTKEIDEKFGALLANTGFMDREMLSLAAKAQCDLVRLTYSDPEKGETLRDQKIKAVFATLFSKADEIEKERLEREQLDDEIELKGLNNDDPDDDDNK